MAAYAVRQLTADGLIDALVAVSAADSFPNTGDQILEVLNGGGVPTTVAIVTPATVGGRAVSDVSQVIAAGARWKFGPFDPGLFNDSSGNVNVTYTATATVTAQVFRGR